MVGVWMRDEDAEQAVVGRDKATDIREANCLSRLSVEAQ